jgi:hypothetical protein
MYRVRVRRLTKPVAMPSIPFGIQNRRAMAHTGKHLTSEEPKAAGVEKGKAYNAAGRHL